LLITILLIGIAAAILPRESEHSQLSSDMIEPAEG
jgi:hypothetical protein